MNKNEKIKKEEKVGNSKETENLDDVKDLKSDLENKTSRSEDAFEEKNENTDAEEISIEEKLREEIIQLKDEKLRLLAEMENLRKRSDRDRIDSIRYGSINFARDILSLDDNLTRALEAISEEEEKSKTIINLIAGLKMVQKEFSGILEKYGVKKIDALNQKFDHNFHQAMVEIEDDKIDEGIVIQEIQNGYTMYDRLLRPSMVGVSKKTSKNKKDKEKN
jgi:molecular chaperone GrpE